MGDAHDAHDDTHGFESVGVGVARVRRAAMEEQEGTAL